MFLDLYFYPIKVSKELVPFFVGLTVLGIGICFGYNCGYAVNPARDFAPRLFSGNYMCKYYLQLYSVFYPALAGWGPDVFTYSYHWWVVGPSEVCATSGAT